MLIKTSVETTTVAVHCLLWQLALTMVLLHAVGHCVELISTCMLGSYELVMVEDELA